MSLVTNITELATRIATEIKLVKTWVNGNATDLSGLTTTAKGNLVSAINEIKDSQASAAGINDTTTSTTTTWSSSKTSTELANKQAADPDLTAIAALTSTTAGAIASDGAGGWIKKSYADFKTALGLTKADVGLANVDNTSDANKPVSSATQTALNGKANSSHAHAIGDLPVATSGTSNTTQLVRADDSRLSNARTPSAHTHATSEVTGLDTALAGKASTSHTHTASQVTDFNASVDARVQLVVDSAPSALDTLNELAAAIGDDANFAGTVTTALGNRVAVDSSQAFTAPQQAQGRANIAAAAAADLTTLSNNVGNTAANFVTTFDAGLV
jgi:hypothetical protein